MSMSIGDLRSWREFLRSVSDNQTVPKTAFLNSEPITLRDLSPVVIPRIKEGFVVRRNFVRGRNLFTGVKIADRGKRFVANFGRVVEKPSQASILVCFVSKPLKPLPEANEPVVLGENHRTGLAQVYFLMRAQRKGKVGVLRTNSDLNIFPVLNHAGVLCPVFVFWRPGWFGGWSVNSGTFHDPFWRFGRYQLFVAVDETSFSQQTT